MEPQRIFINEQIIQGFSKELAFWQAPQFLTQVTSTIPILNKFHSQTLEKTLELIPDPDEILFRFEV